MSRTLQMNSNLPPRGSKVFGFPLEGFSLFQSLLLAIALAFFTFFATTCLAIFALLIWRMFNPQALHYAVDTYRYVGFPAGVLVLVLAVPFFLTLWVRAKIRK